MGSVYDLKPAFQKLLRPLCRVLKEAGISPNHITIGAVVLSVIMGSTIVAFSTSTWPLLALPAFLFVRMALNAIDGMMAREYGMTSKLGGVLNELGDVVSDVVVYLPLAMIPAIPVAPIVSLVVLAVISEMAGVVAVQIGGTRRYDGPMGKSDRALVLGLLALLMPSNAIPEVWMPTILWGVSGLLVVTIFNRCSRGLKEAAE